MDELMPCPFCNKQPAPYHKGVGCVTSGCILNGLHLDYDKWQARGSLPAGVPVGWSVRRDSTGAIYVGVSSNRHPGVWLYRDGGMDERRLWAYFDEVLDAVPAALAADPVESPESQLPGHDQLWNWFGLSYAAWLTLPRVLMHEMPGDWQARMAELLGQWDDAWTTGHLPAPEVTAKSDGKYAAWPAWLLNYRHPDRGQINRCRAGSPAGQGGGK